MQGCLFIRRGQCSQPNFRCNVLVGRHLYKAHIVILLSYFKCAEFCEPFHLLSKSVLHCYVSYEMILISNPLAAMESSSVYMCFPCYQEFNTLEEVLEHQLTCTAEDEQPDTSGTIPVNVPLLQTRVNNGTVNPFPFLSYDCASGVFEWNRIELIIEIGIELNIVMVWPDMTSSVIT